MFVAECILHQALGAAGIGVAFTLKKLRSQDVEMCFLKMVYEVLSCALPNLGLCDRSVR